MENSIGSVVIEILSYLLNATFANIKKMDVENNLILWQGKNWYMIIWCTIQVIKIHCKIQWIYDNMRKLMHTQHFILDKKVIKVSKTCIFYEYAIFYPKIYEKQGW